MLSSSLFPVLNAQNQEKDSCLHVFLKSQLISLFFSWNRIHCSPLSKTHDLGSSLLHVLTVLKSALREPGGEKWLCYLKLYYQWMAFTRDAYHGKGEHELTYCMILVWYDVFPTLAIYFLHQLVQYGSWRDFPYLCHHVSLKKGVNHALIDICVEMMNRQLETDSNSLFSGNYSSISYVAKWIPREYKKFDWLHSRCVQEWAMKHHSYLFQHASVFSSYHKALTKCKGMYRKKIALLNHYLDTTEIKQCSRNESLLNPRNVSKYTLMKQPEIVVSDLSSVSLLSQEREQEKQLCRQHFQQYYDTSIFSSSHKGRIKHKGISLPVSYYIQTAFALIDSGNTTGYSARLLNKQWTIFSKQVLPKHLSREPVLPLLDVSLKMQLEEHSVFYTAIGMAILVAQKSLLGRRILAVDQHPIWINFSESTSLIETLILLRSQLRSQERTYACFQKATDLLQSLFLLNPAMKSFLRLVVFSNTFGSFGDNDSVEMDLTLGSGMYNMFRNSFQGEPPHISFWNVGHSGNIPCSPFQPHCLLFSGSSVNVLKELFLFPSKKRTGGGMRMESGVGSEQDETSYQRIFNMISSTHYSGLSRYVDTICSSC